MNRNWIIGFVNHKTSTWLKWQLKCIYESNNPNLFKIIIVDNSCDSDEKIVLNQLLESYNKKYNNITIDYTILH